MESDNKHTGYTNTTQSIYFLTVINMETIRSFRFYEVNLTRSECVLMEIMLRNSSLDYIILCIRIESSQEKWAS